MSNSPLGRERRSGKTFSKHIKLTPIGREKIERWATDNNINFSAAIESLALLGLQDERTDFVIPSLRAVTKQGLTEAFSQINQTLGHVQQEATLSRLLTEAILLQWIRREAVQQPDDFETAMGVSKTSRSQLDQRIRHFHDNLKGAALTQALQQIESLLDDEHRSDKRQGGVENE